MAHAHAWRWQCVASPHRRKAHDSPASAAGQGASHVQLGLTTPLSAGVDGRGGDHTAFGSAPCPVAMSETLRFSCLFCALSASHLACGQGF